MIILAHVPKNAIMPLWCILMMVNAEFRTVQHRVVNETYNAETVTIPRL